MKKSIKSLILFSAASLLVGCGTVQDDVEYTILAPQGAPTLALYEEIIAGNVNTTSDTTSIPAQMQLSEGPDFVVFDSINALKLTNNAKKANYTYLKMLTIGNFYLVGLNKEEGSVPTVDDYIVSFGQGGVTDETFSYLYPELYNSENTIHYVTAVSDVAPIIRSGLHENNKVDWCFVAQPVLYTLMNALNNDDNTENDIKPTYNVLDMVKEKSNGTLNFIPQAGLFVRNDFLKENKETVDHVVSKISSSMNKIINNYQDVKTTIDALDDTKKAKFGTLNTSMFDYYKENTYKEFGISNIDKIEVSDINNFLETINSSTKIVL